MAGDQSETERIFDQARKLQDPQQRASYLENACGGDSELKQRVEGLLKAQIADTETSVKVLRPAGFWIRVVAFIVDGLVLMPLGVLAMYSILSAKSPFLLFLVSCPSVLYTPLMHAYYGATLGKRACGLRVIDESGENLTVYRAFIRFSLFLAGWIVTWLSTLWLFSNPEYESAIGYMNVVRLIQKSPWGEFETLLEWVVLIDCATAAFTAQKRAIHDMMAQSFCIYEDQKLHSPLHRAARNGHTDIVESLLAKGANVNDVGGSDGWTPLHYAAWHGHKNMTELLLDKGADVNAKDSHGKEPLDYARQGGRMDVVEMLIDRGGN